MNDITAFFAFLKYCLGYKENMSRMVAGMDWQKLYSFASKQAFRIPPSPFPKGTPPLSPSPFPLRGQGM